MVMTDRGHKQPTHYHFPFAGFIRCGECGMTITGEKHIKYYKTIERHQTFIYYRCTKKNNSKSCSQLYLREEHLLPQLNDIIQKVSLSTSDYESVYQPSIQRRNKAKVGSWGDCSRVQKRFNRNQSEAQQTFRLIYG